MAEITARKVLLKDIDGRYIVPLTGAVETINGQKPDANGNIDALARLDDLAPYLTEADAASTYLGKTEKAASAATADSATTATKLSTSRKISLVGQVTGSGSFDGSSDANISASLADTGVTAGTYGESSSATLVYGAEFDVPSVAVDPKGRITSAKAATLRMPATPVTSINGSTGDVTLKDYVTGLSVSGKTVTYTKKDGTSGTITTQDTVYTHPNSGVTAGTYNSVTVNAQGHVIAGENVEDLSNRVVVAGSSIEPRTLGQWMLRKGQVFHSVAEMKASMVLADGMSCVTEGYYEPGDGGMGFYRIRPMTASDVDDGGSIHALQNGLCAELIDEGFVRPEQFGAKGDGVTDDTGPLMRCLALDRENYCSKIYKTTSPIVTRSGQRINFPGELRYVGDDTAILVSNGTDIRLNMNIVRSMGDGLKIEPGTTDTNNAVSECKFCIDKIYAYRHGVNVVCVDETATKACQLNVFKLPYVRANFYDWDTENAERSGDGFRVVLSSPRGWVAGNVVDCSLINGRYGLFLQKNSGVAISENIFKCFTESSNGIANIYLKASNYNDITINFQEGPGKIVIEDRADENIKVYGVTTESFVDSLDVSKLHESTRVVINGKIYTNGGDLIAESMVITGYGCYLTDLTYNRCIDLNYGEYSPGKTLRCLRVYSWGNTGEYVLPSFIGGGAYREKKVEVVVSEVKDLTLKDVDGNTVFSVGSVYTSGVYVCIWNLSSRKWLSTQITTP